MLLVGIAFGVFGIGAFSFGVLVLPWLWLWGGPLPERRRRCQRLVAASFRAFHRALAAARLIDFDTGRALSDPRWPRSRQFVAVANHPSLLETLAVLAVASPICCVVAPWLSRNPLLCPLLLACGHVLSRGDSFGDRLAVLEAAAARLESGHSLLVFPEGTRSPDAALGAFQRGAFELALRFGLPLLPVLCRITPPVLTRGAAWYDLPGCSVRVELEPLDLWEPFEYSRQGLDAKQLAAGVRKQLATALGQAHPGKRLNP